MMLVPVQDTIARLLDFLKSSSTRGPALGKAMSNDVGTGKRGHGAHTAPRGKRAGGWTTAAHQIDLLVKTTSHGKASPTETRDIQLDPLPNLKIAGEERPRHGLP